MGYVVISAVFAVLIVILEIFSRQERRELYDRIMSRDISEFKAAKNYSAEQKRSKTARQKAVEAWKNGENSIK